MRFIRQSALTLSLAYCLLTSTHGAGADDSQLTRFNNLIEHAEHQLLPPIGTERLYVELTFGPSEPMAENLSRHALLHTPEQEPKSMLFVVYEDNLVVHAMILHARPEPRSASQQAARQLSELELKRQIARNMLAIEGKYATQLAERPWR